MDLDKYRGIGIFGPAYRVMLENDAHAPGSVDRVLLEQMVLLCPETAAFLYSQFTPPQANYQKGALPELERHVAKATGSCDSDEARVAAIAGFCRGLADKVSAEPDGMRFGGMEEEVIRRGSDWCGDLARVGCVLCQVAGVTARLVYLADTENAYSGHVIIEARREGHWGAVDTTANVIYRRPDGKPASTWELMNHAGWIEAHSRGIETPYTNRGQFLAAAISNYFACDRQKYDYTISPMNTYYRSILEMSAHGWPGGIRWLHGENEQRQL